MTQAGAATTGIAWLSSSAAEITRARAVLKALTPGGVIDELGFLIFTGAFADYFYPAVTTPMTRARYLVFIPAIYRHLERTGTANGKDVDGLARRLQYELLKVLMNTDPDGAIGREKGPNVVRPPADIYWSALAALGLATQKLSEAAYQRRLAAGGFRTTPLEDDDKARHPEEDESLWDAALRTSHVIQDGTFAPHTSFRLRRAEAALLLERYARLNDAGHDSLIVHMVSLARQRRLQRLDGLEHLWQVPGLSAPSRAAAEHARLLSLFARGATLQYHRMLIEKKKAGDTGTREAFIAWWDAACDGLAKWPLDDFFALMQRRGADRRLTHDRRFISGWIGRCRAAASGARALEDPEARRIIGEREDRVRPGKQRLRVKHQLDAFQPFSSYSTDVLYQLEYRHRVGRRFAEDIANAFEDTV